MNWQTRSNDLKIALRVYTYGKSENGINSKFSELILFKTLDYNRFRTVFSIFRKKKKKWKKIVRVIVTSDPLAGRSASDVLFYRTKVWRRPVVVGKICDRSLDCFPRYDRQHGRCIIRGVSVETGESAKSTARGRVPPTKGFDLGERQTSRYGTVTWRTRATTGKTSWDLGDECTSRGRTRPDDRRPDHRKPNGSLYTYYGDGAARRTKQTTVYSRDPTGELN